MKMKPINSGRLRAIGYDALERHLHVNFDNGDTLRYSDVGEDLWHRFNTASSHWDFLCDHIDTTFDSSRISENPPNWQNLFVEYLAKE